MYYTLVNYFNFMFTYPKGTEHQGLQRGDAMHLKAFLIFKPIKDAKYWQEKPCQCEAFWNI